MSRNRLKLFRIFLVVLPPLFFLLLEFMLRVANYGGDLALVLTAEENGTKYYTLNQGVGKRYFSEKRYYLPKVYDDRFEVKKSANTVRVFCLGASTTAGFPYEYQATPSRLLHDRLVLSLPDKNVEVINAGLTATNSFTVLEFAQELVNYQPDLFIVYMGQNEFYGAYGVGSTISLGKRRWFVKAYLQLQHYRTLQLIRDGVSSVRSLFVSEKESIKQGTLMEQMVQNSLIPRGSEDYDYAKEAFAANYREIIETARAHNVPVIASTLVVNEKDLEPFVSLFRPDLPEGAKNEWEVLFLEGLRKEKEGLHEIALDFYTQAVQIDSMPARIHFRFGKCYEELGRLDKARIEYTKARDLDGLRFRVPSEFNTIVRKLAKEHDLPLADVEGAFRDVSQDGIIGREFLWEHVHPKLEGYFLMAKTWAAAIREHSLMDSERNSPTWAEPHDSVCWRDASITDVDRAIGAVRIAKLMQQWPFQSSEEKFRFQPATIAEGAALEYIKENTAWSDAHYRAAEEYSQRQRWMDAFREYAAVNKTAPRFRHPVIRMGDMLIQMEKQQEAEEMYLEALRLKEDQFIHARLGMLYLEEEELEPSIRHLQKCLEMDGRLSSKLPVEGKRQAQFYLGLAYAKSGQFAAAKKELTSLLKEDPNSENARSLLNQVESRAR